jgi:threonine/homoserine/homoserine lactone efflux protein
MEAAFFGRGFLIGLSIAAPVGPIGVLCIRRTIAFGRASGFISGLGAASADAVYGAIAAFGLSSISGFLIHQQMALRLIGGLFLVYLGFKTFVAKPKEGTAPVPASALTGAYLSTLALTLTNPMTILSFVWIFAGFGLGSEAGDFRSAGFIVLGVFIGSAAWWLLLSGGVGLFRKKFHLHSMQWVNRISGGIIMIFGVLALLHFAYDR